MNYLKLKNKIKKLEDEKFAMSWSKFKLGRENEQLKEKIERLEKLNKDLIHEKAFLNLELEKKLKEQPVVNISMNKESVDNIVKKVTENILGKQEHKCTEVCFKAHVLDPIQSDIYKKFGDDIVTRSENLNEMVQFVETWRIKLVKEYPFLEDLYTMNFGELTAVYK